MKVATSNGGMEENARYKAFFSTQGLLCSSRGGRSEK
jgi:hypothetical protein